MLITPRRLASIWGLQPEVVVHIGAHEAEELEPYRQLGWGKRATVWVDAQPAKAALVRDRVRAYPEHRVIEAVLWDRAGERLEFKETNDTQASSLLELGVTTEIYPDIVVTGVREVITQTAADALPFDELGRVDLVNLDIQGAELHALKGFGEHLGQVRAIYSEVNSRELYRGGALFGELDEWLTGRGFRLVDQEMLWGVAWGDALWLRAEDVPSNAAARRRRRRLLDLPKRIKHVIWWLVKGRRSH